MLVVVTFYKQKWTEKKEREKKNGGRVLSTNDNDDDDDNDVESQHSLFSRFSRVKYLVALFKVIQSNSSPLEAISRPFPTNVFSFQNSVFTLTLPILPTTAS